LKLEILKFHLYVIKKIPKIKLTKIIPKSALFIFQKQSTKVTLDFIIGYGVLSPVASKNVLSRRLNKLRPPKIESC